MNSPTHKHGNYTKLMQIKFFSALKSIELASKYTTTTKSKKAYKTLMSKCQKFDFQMLPKMTTLLPKYF